MDIHAIEIRSGAVVAGDVAVGLALVFIVKTVGGLGGISRIKTIRETATVVGGQGTRKQQGARIRIRTAGNHLDGARDAGLPGELRAGIAIGAQA